MQFQDAIVDGDKFLHIDRILIDLSLPTIIPNILKSLAKGKLKPHAIGILEMLRALLKLVLRVPVMNLDGFLVRREEDELFQQLETIALTVMRHPIQTLEQFLTCLMGARPMGVHRVVEEGERV